MMLQAIKQAKHNSSEEGFTLIELMVVVVIIGILAAIAIPIFMNQQKAAIVAGTQTDLKNVVTAITTATTKNNGKIPYGCSAAREMFDNISITPGTEIRYGYSTVNRGEFYVRAAPLNDSFKTNPEDTEANDNYRSFYLNNHGKFYKTKRELATGLENQGTNIVDWLSENSFGVVIVKSDETGVTYNCSGGVS